MIKTLQHRRLLPLPEIFNAGNDKEKMRCCTTLMHFSFKAVFVERCRVLTSIPTLTPTINFYQSGKAAIIHDTLRTLFSPPSESFAYLRGISASKISLRSLPGDECTSTIPNTFPFSCFFIAVFRGKALKSMHENCNFCGILCRYRLLFSIILDNRANTDNVLRNYPVYCITIYGEK